MFRKSLALCVLALVVLWGLSTNAHAAVSQSTQQTQIVSTSSDATATSTPIPSTWGGIKAVYGMNDAGNQNKHQGPGINAIGSKRYWVRNECWYALDKAWLYKGDDLNGPGGNGTMSNWNYLSTTADAGSNGLNYALNTYQTCVSNLIPPICGCCAISTSMSPPQNTVSYWVGQLSADSYGLNYLSKHYGHGCQCVSFVSMVIYRATAGSYRLSWSWGSSPKSSDPSAINAQPGDIVYKNSGGIQHIGICVANYGTGITVVDSNWVGGGGNEIIGRHDLSSSYIGTSWKMQSGSGRWY